MKVEVVVNNAKLLATRLAIASGAIGKNPVLPILEDFHIDVKNSVMKITASDLEVTLITLLDVECERDFQICIPNKIFLETIKGLGELPFSMVLDMDTLGLSIVSLTGNYKITCDHPADFPITNNETTNILEIDSVVIKRGIRNVGYATTDDAMRMAMTGVFFNFEKDKFVMCATDAHMLAEHTFKGVKPLEKKQFIIPDNGISMINTLPDGEKVTIGYAANNIVFSTSSTTIVCRNIDAKFPEYSAVIPKEFHIGVKVNRKDFLSSIKRMALFANKVTNQVIFNIDKNEIKFEVNDFDLSNSANERIKCEPEKFEDDHTFRIALNAKILKELITAGITDEMTLLFISSSRAMVSIDDSVDNERTISLAMPIMMGN